MVYNRRKNKGIAKNKKINYETKKHNTKTKSINIRILFNSQIERFKINCNGLGYFVRCFDKIYKSIRKNRVFDFAVKNELT